MARPPTFSDIKKNVRAPNPLNWAKGGGRGGIWNVLGTKDSICESSEAEKSLAGQEGTRKSA